jgi:hypothetical protein
MRLSAVTINVDSYGADGSDSIDDTSFINNAIAQLSNGDTLEFSSGTYIISDMLNLSDDNVTVTFNNGAKLKIDDNIWLPVAFLCAKDGITFNNLYIDGNNRCYLGLHIYICNNVTINNSKFINLEGDFPTTSYAAAGIFIRTCTNVTISDSLFENIISSAPATTSLGATGIVINSINSSEKSDNIDINNCEFINIKSIKDADGIKVIGHDIDINSAIEYCFFYNCYKRAIKLQSNNIQISNVTIINDTTETDYQGSYLVDFQDSDNSSITDSEIYVPGRNLAAIGLGGNNNLIENVDIYQKRKTNEDDAYYTYGIRNQGYALSNLQIRNVNIYGDFFQAFRIADCGVACENIDLDNIYTEKMILITTGSGTGNSVSNSSYGSCYFNNGDVAESNNLVAYKAPVAHYKLDESSGTVYDTSGNLNDSDQTYGLTYACYGVIDKSIDFNGTSSYIRIPNSSCLENINHHLTVSAWIYAEDSRDACIVNKKYDSWNNGFELKTYYGCLSFRFGDGTNGYSFYSDPNAYSLNNWHHVAVVYNGKKVKFYVDGILKGSSQASGRIAPNIYNVYIGKYQSSARFFNGKIDDVRIYNRSLTSYQIKEAGYMRAYYKLETNDVSNSDETGYNSATLYGSPSVVTGQVDDCLEFNNSPPVYLIAPSNAGLNLSTNFTLAAWIKPDTLSGSASIICKGYASSATGYELRTYYSKLRLMINDTIITSSQDLLTINDLQHVAVTFDGTDAKFYVNGDHKETVTTSGITMVENGNSLHVGIYQDNNNYAFDGKIDDVRLFSCDLLQDEIYELFSEGWIQYQP